MAPVISVKIDGMQATLATLSGNQKQIGYAASRALNSLAFDAMRAGRSQMREFLDRPTNYALTAWRVRRKAKPSDLATVVGWSDALSSKRIQEGQDAGAEYYLAQHWKGGGRKLKAYERHLRQTGILPAGMFTVPGKAATDLGMMDAHGNMKPSVIVAIMSAVGGLDELGYSANATIRQSKRMSANALAKRRTYWVGKPGVNTPLGIWMIDEKFSARGRLRPVLIFVRAPKYRARLSIDKIHSQVVTAGWKTAFEKELLAALRTAR